MKSRNKWFVCKYFISAVTVSNIPQSWCWYLEDIKQYKHNFYIGLRVVIKPDFKHKLWCLHLGPFVFYFGLTKREN